MKTGFVGIFYSLYLGDPNIDNWYHCSN